MKPKDNKKTYTTGKENFAKASAPKKVFDVARPGKTPAQPGARPVITNRATVDDPDISSKRSLMNPKQKITITPMDGNAPEEQKLVTKPQPKEPTGPPPVDDRATPQVSLNAQKEDKPEPKPIQTEPTRATFIEQEQPTAKTEPKTYEKPSPAQLAEDNTVEPDNHERVEPMHMGMPQEFNPGSAVVSQHGRRRTLGLEILSVLIILLLLAAIVNLLLDAEIIKTNLNIPYTNFFEQT